MNWSRHVHGLRWAGLTVLLADGTSKNAVLWASRAGMGHPPWTGPHRPRTVGGHSPGTVPSRPPHISSAAGGPDPPPHCSRPSRGGGHQDNRAAASCHHRCGCQGRRPGRRVQTGQGASSAARQAGCGGLGISVYSVVCLVRNFTSFHLSQTRSIRSARQSGGSAACAYLPHESTRRARNHCGQGELGGSGHGGACSGALGPQCGCARVRHLPGLAAGLLAGGSSLGTWGEAWASAMTPLCAHS